MDFTGRALLYAQVIQKGVASSAFNDLDFTTLRSNFQSAPTDKYYFQAYRSMNTVWAFIGMTAAFSASLWLTRLRGLVKNQPVVVHMGIATMVTGFYGIGYAFFWAPFRFYHITQMPNSGYAAIAQRVLDTTPDGHLLKRAFNIKDKPMPGHLYATPNFECTGLPAVIVVSKKERPPPGSVYIDEAAFYNDMKDAIELVNSQEIPWSPTSLHEQRKLEMVELLKGNTQLVMTMRGITRPYYFDSLVSDGLNTTTVTHNTTTMSNKNQPIEIHSPSPYVMVSPEDVSTSNKRGDIPAIFLTPQEMHAQRVELERLQRQENELAKKRYLEQYDITPRHAENFPQDIPDAPGTTNSTKH